MAHVKITEDLPDMVWGVHVGDALVATITEADEGVVNWWTVETDVTEQLTIEEMTARISSLGEPGSYVPFS